MLLFIRRFEFTPMWSFEDSFHQQGPLLQPERLHTQSPHRTQVLAAGLLAAVGHGAPPLLLTLLKLLSRVPQRILPFPPAGSLSASLFPHELCSCFVAKNSRAIISLSCEASAMPSAYSCLQVSAIQRALGS